MKLTATLVHRLATLVLLSVVVALAVPLTPPRQVAAYNFLSAEQEAAMGIEAFETLKKEKNVVRRGREVAAVEAVADRLQRVVSVPHAEWEFVVFEDEAPNAFALPGGKVGVHTGLFDVVQNEAQLAAVLGHELGHVTARHAGKRVSRSIVGSTLGGIAGLLLEKKTGVDGRTAQQVTQGAAALRILQFSRSQELEADRSGAIYMARAGYDPRESINLWKQMAAYKARKGAGAPIPFLSTHPMDDRRITELEVMMPEAMAIYRGPGHPEASARPAREPLPENPPKALPFRPGRR